jgi:hypothetical protein
MHLFDDACIEIESRLFAKSGAGPNALIASTSQALPSARRYPRSELDWYADAGSVDLAVDGEHAA